MAAGIVNVRRDVDDKFYRYRCVHFTKWKETIETDLNITL